MPQYMESVGDMDPIEAEMQLREWARENVIERMLLKAAALADPDPFRPRWSSKAFEAVKTEAGGKVGCGTRTTDGDVREQIETQYRLERLLARVQSNVTPPKPKEISEFYKRNKERFHTPELIHAAHIVKNVDEQHDEATAPAQDRRGAMPSCEVALHWLRSPTVIRTAPAMAATWAGFLAAKWSMNSMPSFSIYRWEPLARFSVLRSASTSRPFWNGNRRAYGH